jgi:hypothetical protein
MAHMTSAFDSKKLAELKAEILDLLRKRHPAIDRGLQFEDVHLTSDDPRHVSVILMLREILTKHPGYDLVQWPMGVALVKAGQTATLSGAYREVNERTHFIIRGGTDEANNIVEDETMKAVPTGTVTGD